MAADRNAERASGGRIVARAATAGRGALALVLMASCAEPPVPVDGGAAGPGEPLPGLTAAQFARFETGRTLFNREFTPADGLGPLFNQRRCSSCHDLPTLGGAGAELVSRAARFTGGRCDLLINEGGDLIQERATDALRRLGIMSESLPESANLAVGILPTPLYGAGLIEAVPDSAIRSRADPNDRDRDGISGRTGTTRDGQVGRFGRKADHATIASFTGVAIRLELGLTTPDHPAEETINGRPVPPEADPVPDPEVDSATLGALVDYVRFLAAPAPETPKSAAARDSFAAGERVFESIGCADCHVPALATASSDVAALDGKTVRLYSDLLLHDMGPELASLCAPGAAPSEWRTVPLLGLRHRHALMHDGRASAHERAILLHGGEADAARRSFERLGRQRRALLMRFLRSL